MFVPGITILLTSIKVVTELKMMDTIFVKDTAKSWRVAGTKKSALTNLDGFLAVSKAYTAMDTNAATDSRQTNKATQKKRIFLNVPSKK